MNKLILGEKQVEMQKERNNSSTGNANGLTCTLHQSLLVITSQKSEQEVLSISTSCRNPSSCLNLHTNWGSHNHEPSIYLLLMFTSTHEKSLHHHHHLPNTDIHLQHSFARFFLQQPCTILIGKLARKLTMIRVWHGQINRERERHSERAKKALTYTTI